MDIQIGRDLAYVLRTLRRNIGFATLVIGGLAIGIGANTAIYSLIDAVMLRKLPVARSGELVALGLTENIDGSGHGTPGAIMYSYPLYRDVRDRNDVFTGLLATGSAGRLDLRVDSTAAELEHPKARFVSGNYFHVLGVGAAIGRTLGPADDVAGAPPAATISYGYWTRRFQNDRFVIGRILTINDVRVTITGVAARDFAGEVVGASTDLWLPISIHDDIKPHDRLLEHRADMWLLLLGRAKAGLTLDQVKQRIIPIIKASILEHSTSQQLSRLTKQELEYPISSGARGLSRVRARFGAPLDALMAGVGLLFCVVCVNIANLLLARGIARRREITLRLALGARRGQVVRLLLGESAVIALLGAIAAVILAWWASHALVAIAGADDPLVLAMDPNGRVLSFTLAVALLSVLLFGLAPSLRSSRVDLATSIRAGSRSITGEAGFGSSLLVAQVALCLVLLTGALTLAVGLRAALATDLGFDQYHLIAAKLDIEARGYAGARLANAVKALRDRIAAVPGVRAVTYSENGLFEDTEWSSTIDVPGVTPLSSEDSTVATDGVGAGYASSIGARLIAGRDFTQQDEGAAARVAIVNQSFARFYFPGQNTIGRAVRLNPSNELRIVGVVADVRGQSLGAPVGHHARRLYYPYLHGGDTAALGEPSELRLLIRTTDDPARLTPALRRIIATADPTLPIEGLRTVSSLIGRSIQEERLATQVAAGLAILAIALAAIGLFGVMSYSVARRTSEIGIRIALGARGANVGGMIVREAMRPVAIGLVLGTPMLLVSTRLLREHLSMVASSSVPSALAAAAVLVLCGFIAAFAPAMHATRIDPVAALREE